MENIGIEVWHFHRGLFQVLNSVNYNSALSQLISLIDLNLPTVPAPLTLYPPRGGEISPPLEKMWCNFYVGLAKFFNSWWFFKLKPLTPFGEVIFLFWNPKCFKISYPICLIPMIYESKIKKTLFSLVFWGKSYFFAMKLTFLYILAFLRGI